MKLKQLENSGTGGSLGSACLHSCKEALAQVKKVKDAIFAEARETFQAREQLLRLALNEAEALAWQTLYPQLVFPNLAVEKVRGAAAWSDRQCQLA